MRGDEDVDVYARGFRGLREGVVEVEVDGALGGEAAGGGAGGAEGAEEDSRLGFLGELGGPVVGGGGGDVEEFWGGRGVGRSAAGVGVDGGDVGVGEEC